MNSLRRIQEMEAYAITIVMEMQLASKIDSMSWLGKWCYILAGKRGAL